METNTLAGPRLTMKVTDAMVIEAIRCVQASSQTYTTDAITRITDQIGRYQRTRQRATTAGAVLTIPALLLWKTFSSAQQFTTSVQWMMALLIVLFIFLLVTWNLAGAYEEIDQDLNEVVGSTQDGPRIYQLVSESLRSHQLD